MGEQQAWKYDWIDSEAQLAEVSAAIAKEEFVSLDTETAGWETDNERLCLIQIGLPSQERVYILDALAIRTYGPLEAQLRAPSPVLVAHNAAFEERQFESIGIRLGGLVDTLAMSRRLRPDLPSHSLQSCCKFILNLRISKEEQRSNWSRRPLSQSQIRYAALDAEVTVKLFQSLREIEALEVVDPNLDLSGLMAELSKAVMERIEIMAPISDRVAKLNAREESIRAAMQTRLLAGEPPYDGPLGRCKLFHRKNYEIDPHKVRELFPHLAHLAIEECVDAQRFEALLKENKIDIRRLGEVLRERGSTPRVSISLQGLIEN